MSVAADFDANTAGWDAEQLSSSDDDGAAAAASGATTSASGMPGSSTDALYSGLAADDDLYGGLDGATALPSTLELRRQLDEATAERRALEAEEAELRRKFETGKAAVKDLLHKACQLLVTARHELERKDTMIAAERGRRRGQQPGEAGQRGSGSGSQRSDDDARRRNG